MNLNLPILDQIKDCKNVLIAGMGGGYDVFCGLPIFFELQKMSVSAHLANYSFSDIETFTGGQRLSPTLVGVDAEYDDIVVYFPELYLAQWFKQYRKQDLKIWSFHKTSSRSLIDNYKILVKHLEIDAIILVDGGVDSLVRGDEQETASLIEDAISLCAVNELQEVPVKIVSCIGFGAERDLSYSQILENISLLIKLEPFMAIAPWHRK